MFIAVILRSKNTVALSTGLPVLSLTSIIKVAGPICKGLGLVVKDIASFPEPVLVPEPERVFQPKPTMMAAPIISDMSKYLFCIAFTAFLNYVNNHHKPTRLNVFVGRMVGYMTMQHPFAWPIRRKFDIITLTRRHGDSVFCPLSRFRNVIAVSCQNFKGKSMEVHRVNHLAAPDKAQSHLLTNFNIQCFGIWESLSVNGKKVTVHTRCWHCGISLPINNPPFIKHEDAIYIWF